MCPAIRTWHFVVCSTGMEQGTALSGSNALPCKGEQVSDGRLLVKPHCPHLPTEKDLHRAQHQIFNLEPITVTVS